MISILLIGTLFFGSNTQLVRARELSPLTKLPYEFLYVNGKYWFIVWGTFVLAAIILEYTYAKSKKNLARTLAVSAARLLILAGLLFVVVISVDMGTYSKMPNYDVHDGLCDCCGNPGTIGVCVKEVWVKTIIRYIGGLRTIETVYDYIYFHVDYPRNDTLGEYCPQHRWVAEIDTPSRSTAPTSYGKSYETEGFIRTGFYALPVFIYIVFLAFKVRNWIRVKKHACGRSQYGAEEKRGDIVVRAECPFCGYRFRPDELGFHPENLCPNCGRIIALARERASQLTVSISPMSASILVGQSVSFASTASGGHSPYNCQWYLNNNPVSSATSTSWTFTPTTSGIYYIHLKVTDAEANTAQSETAHITAAPVSVRGYSV